MKEPKCRFIEEYARFKTSRLEKDIREYTEWLRCNPVEEAKYGQSTREAIDRWRNAISEIEEIVRKIRRGLFPVDEGMFLIAKAARFF